MDTSFLSAGPVTWPVLAAFAAFLITLGTLIDWLVGKLRAGTKDAVSPLTIDMAAAKIEIASLNEKLNAFKIEVARTYVTGDVIHRLERRIDDLVTSVRDEMKETRDIMLRAISNRPPG